MANTKNLTREERKAAKRKARLSAKKLFGSLTPKEKKVFRKAETSSLKSWIAERDAAAQSS